MKKPHPASRYWNEFEWEREIRRDERRISSFYCELGSCLDLPLEGEIISGTLAGLSDPVAAPGKPADSTRRRFFDDDDEDSGSDNEHLTGDGYRPGSEAVARIDYLASEWGIITASTLHPELMLPGMGVSCAYGKVLARMIDFVDADPIEEKGLKLSLGKRVLADVNDLLGVLEEIAWSQPVLTSALSDHCRQLIEVREKTVDILNATRRGI